MNVAHNSKRNRRDTTTQDGDDYVYPTKKVREHKTRARKHDRNLIEKGLIDLEFQSFDEPEEEEADNNDWYDDTPMASDEDIAAEMDEKEDFNSTYNLSLHDDYGYDWEDY